MHQASPTISAIEEKDNIMGHQEVHPQNHGILDRQGKILILLSAKT